MKKIFFLVACLLAAGTVGAQQYKWVDKNGKVQYGDSPPPGVKATSLRPPPAGAASSPAPKGPAAAGKKDKDKPLTPEEAFQQRQKEAKEKQEKAAKEQADAATKRENCARAQDSLRVYQAGGRISRVDAKGERVFLDDGQIAAERSKAEAAVRQACSG